MPLSETLSAAVREIYSFNAATGQIKALSDDEKDTSTDFPGLEVFKRSVTGKLIEFPESFIQLRSNAHNVCSLWAEARAQSITVFRVNNFKLSSFKGAKVFK